MINVDNYVNENKTKPNKNWPYNPDHPYRILIIGGSGSGKINLLLNLIGIFFKHACHANPGGSIPYISTNLFLKFSNTSASRNVSHWTYKSWYSPRFFI